MKPGAWRKDSFFWLWLALGAVHLIYSFWLSPRTYFAEDDVLYQFMTMSAARYGSIFLKNGYHEIASPLFAYMYFYMPSSGGELAAQYPPLLAFMGAPFFRLFRTDGIFILNALLFLVNAALIHRIALRMLEDRLIAHAAALLWALATLAWPLSQTALSHTQAVTFILASFCLSLYAVAAQTAARRLFFGALAGLALGAATATRIDSFFSVIGIAALYLFAGARGWRAAVGFVAGALCALGMLLEVNYLKFDILTPFSYGPQSQSIFNIHSYIPQVVMVGAPMGLAWLRQKLPADKRADYVPLLWLLGGFALLLTCAFLPPETLGNLRTILWGHPDSSPNPHDLYEKMVLQNAPFLALAPLSLWLAWRERTWLGSVLRLLIVPTFYTLIFGINANANSVHYYQRFFSPAMPFYCILCAYALLRLLPPRRRAAALYMTAAAASLTLLAHLYAGMRQSHEAQFALLITLPKALAAILLLLSVAYVALDLRGKAARLALVAGSAGLATAAFAACAVLFKDQLEIRRLHAPLERLEATAPFIKRSALVLVGSDQLRFLPVLLEVPDVRIAMPPRGLPVPTPQEVLRVAGYYVQKDRPFYTYFPSPSDIPSTLEKAGYRRLPTLSPDAALIQWLKP